MGDAALGGDVLYVLWLWIACGVAGWYAGGRNGGPFNGLFCGLIFGPLGVAIAWLSPGRRVRCDFCRELVLPAAKVCPHCQREHPVPRREKSATVDPLEERHRKQYENFK
jgi:hypothetical protein